MSFGFGVGDFIAVLQLAKKIWKEFSEAPSQYQAIALEVKNVSLVLQEIEQYVRLDHITDSQQLSDVTASVSTVLKDLEKAILKRSTLLSKQTDLKGKAKRIWARVTSEPEEIRDLRQRLISTLTVLNALVGALSRQDITKLVNTHDLRGILDWLAPRDYAAQHSGHLERRLYMTGQWMLDSPEFQGWISNNTTDYKGLHLQGIPGAGKTILSAIIIDHLHKEYSSNDKIAVCYYYCDYKRQNKEENEGSQSDSQELDGVIPRFLRQLLERSSRVPQHVQDLYSKHQKYDARLTLDDARKAFYLYAKSFDKVYIVVDALDECEAVNGCRRALLSELADAARVSGIHVLATSRPLPDIANAFHRFQSADIKASAEDISRYVEFNISKLPNFVAKNVGLQHEIKAAITASADGIFLLAALHAQSLKGTRSAGALRKALKSFGTGSSAYSEAYEKTMKRIVGQIEDQKELAIETLMWIVYAQRPLKTVELLHALATDIEKSKFDPDDLPDIEDVLSACCGLVIVENEIIRLVHRTAHEFFQGSGRSWLNGAHTRLSKICMTYLAFQDLGIKGSKDMSHEAKISQYPLWDYASWYWQYHGELQEVPMPIEEFAAKQEQIDAASQLLTTYTVPEYLELCNKHPGVTGLHLLALCGLTSLIPSFLLNHDINARDRHQQSPISYAVGERHYDAIRLLVDAGAFLDGLYELGKTLAREFDHIGMHRAYEPHRNYLDNALDLPSMGTYSDGQHLLLWSIPRDIRVAELLVYGGAKLDIVDERGYGPLHWAVCCRAEALFRLLLENGLDPSKMDTMGFPPMYYALNWCCVPIVELLLENKAATSRKGSFPVSSKALCGVPADKKDEMFITASKTGNFNTIVFLLQNGIEINKPDLSGGTALMHAAEYGAEDPVSFLLSNGADVHMVDGKGCTALIHAVNNGNEKNVALLLRAGAKANFKDRDGQTSLMHAARKSDVLVKVFLQEGADANVRDRVGRTALMHSIVKAHEHIAALLIDSGANVDVADNNGYTALIHAVIKDMQHTVTSLLADGANINLVDSSGWTALMHSIKGTNERTVTLLIENGANVNISNNMGHTALMFASMYCPTAEMAALLLGAGAHVHSLDCEGQSALSWTVKHPEGLENVALVSLLLDYGADINICFSEGRTLLDEVLMRGHTATVQVLLDRGAFGTDLDEIDLGNRRSSSWPPLHWACRTGNFDLVKLLINAGIRSSAVSIAQPPSTCMPLDIAFFYKNDDLVARIEATTRQDPFWFSLVSSGIVIEDATARTGIVAARGNGLQWSQNMMILPSCLRCSQALCMVPIGEGHYCFMCKHGIKTKKLLQLPIRRPGLKRRIDSQEHGDHQRMRIRELVEQQTT